ncbi:3-dehydroquinate synthase II [Saliterribacillus persicus]|uniref:3-dehydroquinate synthase II n=1 Tax=Saliterribacillus persicus TaxID=930114 RepID=A0A368YDZ1_9BACI|nr:3-dehydroquinate synthase II [Saliterribacillus persicus]RCW77556.1 3-dehydroquinate synthase II [Saliterribacillus persicus]
MTIQLEEAEIISVEKVGEGARVCIDFIDELDPLEGLLVGNTGYGYMLVLSENRSTETYPARVFRVNSGALHHYVSIDGEKTTYLGEVKPGMKLSLFHQNQTSRQVTVGRVKMEKRPFLRVVSRVGNIEISSTIQEADSVHLLGANAKEVPAISLVAGDKIMVAVDEPGRHLGEKIEEEINEW